MSVVVIQLNPSASKQLVQAYRAYQAPNKDANKLWFFRVGDTAVSLYKSGKAVFQGPGAQDLARRWSPDQAEAQAASTAIDNRLVTIGSDEVGNGSYFGGLAVVASLVSPDQHPRLKELGVADSKALTDAKIRQLAPVLRAEIAHQALLLSPQKYNEIIPSRYNATSVKVALHNQAIFLLLQKVPEPQQIIIDAFTSERNYHRYLKMETNQFAAPFRLVEKAESQCLAVAVSSVIARAMFLEQLDELSQAVGIQLPSGAGTASDQAAARLLRQSGQKALQQTAKLHFKNTEKAKKLAGRF